MIGDAVFLLGCLVPFASQLTELKVGVPQITSDGKDFTQSCHFDYHGTDPDPVFTLTWLFDDKIYKTVTLTNGTTSDTINSADWTGHLGEDLSCSLEQYLNESTHQSNKYVGTLKISPDNLTLQEGRETVITITSTLPIVCPYLPLVLCKIELELDIKGGYSGDVLAVSSCGVQLLGTDWDPSSGKATATSTIASVIDPVFKPSLQHDLSYSVTPDRLMHQMWDNQTTDHVQVTFMDEPYLVCMQLGQFHTYTITGDRLFLDHPGDYVMFKAETNDGNQLQIQTRHIYRRGFRLCAVAVQYNDALVIVNMCAHFVGRGGPSVSQGNIRPRDLRVYNCDSDYEIVTGDGIQISIIISTMMSMDVKLRVPTIYRGKADGACLHNHNSKLGGNHTVLYRVSDNDSLFGIGRRRFFHSPNITNLLTTSYCGCYGQQKTCDSFERIMNPLSPMSRNTLCRLIQPHSFDRLLDRDGLSQVTENFIQPHPYQADLRNNCMRIMRSRVPPFCEHVDEKNMHIFVSGCTEEGQFQYDLASHGFKWSCEETVLRNFSNYHKGPTGELVAPSEVRSLVCPSVCFVGGQCVDGKCVCDNNRHGQNCQILNNDATPRIRGIRGGRFCQMMNSTCYEPMVVTSNIEYGPLLKTKINLLHLQAGKFIQSLLIFHTDAVYENMYSVSVQLSQITATLPDDTAIGFLISLSPDGINYTEPYPYYIYDVRCQRCVLLGDVQCFQNEGTCVIQGRCYLAAERNPVNSSEICNPDKKLMQWSEV